ncbi:MAG TPA: hypothetical protein PKK26_07430, partial [Candidatus Wallbacteria bacterium]|nr:hypothetical protein [Candidatus Wallbacteria bacterium]
QFDAATTINLYPQAASYSNIEKDPIKAKTDPAAIPVGGGNVQHPQLVVDLSTGQPVFEKDPDPKSPTFGQDIKTYGWWRRLNDRASTELWQIEYYNKTNTKVNDFTVATEDLMYWEVFRDENAVTRLHPSPGEKPNLLHVAYKTGKPASSIKVALATINLAGPPTGIDEKMCIDIVSANDAGKQNVKVKDAAFTTKDGGVLGEKFVAADLVEEDKQYRCHMENAPLEFSQDAVRKNIKSGSALQDENGNGIKGGFDFAVRPATSCYYWHVEMLEPMKKTIALESYDTSFKTKVDTIKIVNGVKTTVTVDRDVKLEPVSGTPPGWNGPGAPNKGPRAAAINFGDKWYCTRGINADRAPKDEDPLAGEAYPDFAFTPKEPGVYKVSLVVSSKRWDYTVLGYPSYITDRKGQCNDGTIWYSFFDDGAGGGTPGNGGTIITKNGVKMFDGREGDEDFVGERYVVVTAKKPEANRYISNIKIDGPAAVDENSVQIWTATADLKFISSIDHEKLDKTKTVDENMMKTFNGIGVWDYPKNIFDAKLGWGIPQAFNGIGEDYTKGYLDEPTNSKLAAGATTTETKLRNFGEAPQIIPPMLTNIIGTSPNGAKIFGTSPTVPMWIEGVGTTSDPKKSLNYADLACVEYEWYLAAEDSNTSEVSAKYRCGTKIDGTITEAWDTRRIPDILIAKGRLSDIKPFPGTNINAVTWDEGLQKTD